MSIPQIHPYILDVESDQKYEFGQCEKHVGNTLATTLATKSREQTVVYFSKVEKKTPLQMKRTEQSWLLTCRKHFNGDLNNRKPQKK